MTYPKGEASSLPGTGNAIYQYILMNLNEVGAMPHEIWYKGLATLMRDPRRSAFRGFYPVGETLKISYGGSEMMDYTFTGLEKNAIFVQDLSTEARIALGIQKEAKANEKVFNPNFVRFNELPKDIQDSNKLPGLGLAKGISSYCCKYISPNYSEQNVAEMLLLAFSNPNSQQMMILLHSNHLAWCTFQYTRSGVDPQILLEFYSQNAPEFYIKDIGTIVPAMLWTLCMLGVDPVDVVDNQMSFDLWGIKETAVEIRAMNPHFEVDEVMVA